MKILLKGYYGFGNLADDILMMSVCRILKEMFPDSKLTVMTASQTPDYIKKLAGKYVHQVIPLGPEPPAHLIIQGGGGVYYDFNKGKIWHYLANRITDMTGISFLRRLLLFYRTLKGWPMNGKACRVALGIGIGSFTSSSGKYYYKMAELAGFHWIFPRDVPSYHYLKHLKIKANVVQSTDIAFATDYWLPVLDPSNKRVGTRIGLVLKAWKEDAGYVQILLDVATILRSRGYEITIFVFEADHDKEIEDRFKEFSVLVWKPLHQELGDYLQHICRLDLLVTSRAHGAIVGGALGIPSVCLGIEPKLKNISGMFPLSGSYLGLPLNERDLLDAIHSGLTIPTQDVQADFNNNRLLMLETLKEFRKAVNNHLLHGMDKELSAEYPP